MRLWSRSWIRSLALGVAGPGAATGIGLVVPRTGTTIPSLLYVLAVAGAAATAGLWSGLGAALLSFLGLNFFFTRPLHTFVVANSEDLVALFVFLVVASIVGVFLARAVEERRRAERREREATALAEERARLDAAVTEARLEVEAAQLRAALFSSITHDVRTPLSSIKTCAEGLLDASVVSDPDRRSELVRTVLEEVDRLDRLVRNLLDLARMRAGALSPAKQRMAIGEVLDAVLGRMRSALAPFRIRTIVRADVPATDIDPVQIDQVLSNLLENAARFSPTGAEIEIVVVPLPGLIQVRISDHGPGIPPADLERVFEAFYRGDSGNGRGAGLGLAIAQAIVAAHGGRIWAEGAPGGGAVLVFEIPQARRLPSAETEAARLTKR